MFCRAGFPKVGERGWVSERSDSPEGVTHLRNRGLMLSCRKDFSLCTLFQHFPQVLITCAQFVTVHEGYFRAANFLEPIFSERFTRELNAFAGMNSEVAAAEE